MSVRYGFYDTTIVLLCPDTDLSKEIHEVVDRDKNLSEEYVATSFSIMQPPLSMLYNVSLSFPVFTNTGSLSFIY